MARRQTNAKRPDGQASWRNKAKPRALQVRGSHHERGLTRDARSSIRWQAAGRGEGDVPGLGMPNRISAGWNGRLEHRGVIVVMKAVKAVGAKYARKLDSR